MTGVSQILLITGIILLILLAVLVTYTILRTARLNRDHAEIQKYINEHIDQWYDYLYYGRKHPEVRRHSKNQQRAIEKIFSTFLSNGITIDVERRISSYVRVYFTNDYRKELKSPLWANRVNTLNKIAEFKVPGFDEIYSKREINEMKSFEFYLFLIYLSIYDFERFRFKFLETRKLTEYENKKILSRLNDDSVLSLIPAFSEMSLTTKYAFLNRLARVGHNQPLEWLESLFKDEDFETRIRALKTIQLIGSVHNPENYIEHFKSIVWEERMLVSRLAPVIGENTVPYLKECANDKNRLVQSEALNSLEYFSFNERGWSVHTNIHQDEMKAVTEDK